MQYRFLGKARLKVSAIGYGCPPFQGKLSDADEKQTIAVVHRAIDIGVNFIDTADHNNGNNEEILAKALKGKRGEVVLTTKFGNLRGQPWADGREVEAKPEYVSWACENSLRRLQTDYIDLYYLHRVDPKVPIEDTIGAMSKLVEQGKSPPYRSQRSGSANAAQGECSSPGDRRAERIFTLDARLRSQHDSRRARARHRLCRLLCAGPGISRRCV